METRNEICNYKRIHRLYPHFATPYRYHPSFTFAYEISTVMRVDASETHRVHTEKKKHLALILLKRAEFAKPTILINSELKRNIHALGIECIGGGEGGGREKSNKAPSRFWLIFRYFNRNIAFISFSNIRNYLAIQYEISNANIDFVIRIIIPRRCIRSPGICNLSTFQSKVAAKKKFAFIYFHHESERPNLLLLATQNEKGKKNRFFGNIAFNPGAAPRRRKLCFHTPDSPPAARNYITPTSQQMSSRRWSIK